MLDPAAADGGGCAPQAPLWAHLQCRQGWGSARCLAGCPWRLVLCRGGWRVPGGLPSTWHWCRGRRDPCCLFLPKQRPQRGAAHLSPTLAPLSPELPGAEQAVCASPGLQGSLAGHASEWSNVAAVPALAISWGTKLPWLCPWCFCRLLVAWVCFSSSAGSCWSGDLWDWLRQHRPRSMLTCLEESRKARAAGQAGSHLLLAHRGQRMGVSGSCSDRKGSS